MRLTTCSRGAAPGPAAADAALLRGFAGLHRDHVRVGRPDRQGGTDPGQHVGVLQVAVQQQHLDQRPGASRITVGFAGRGPERLMRRGEDTGARGPATSAVAPGSAPGLRSRISR